MKFTTLLFLVTLSMLCMPKNAGAQQKIQPVDLVYQSGQRAVWIYLPPDYHTTTKRYPVLYMQDGQNLFEASASFAGEWRVDETLDSLHKLGDYGCIVVGIENAREKRTEEYMPHVHPQFGGGGGDYYLNVVMNEIKPQIDSTYRTRPEAHYTAIGGSSLGGLISFWAVLQYPTVFSRAMVFSPSFWIDENIVNDYVPGNLSDVHLYMLGGALEGEKRDMVERMEAMYKTIQPFGMAEVEMKACPDGTHQEWFWAREFGPAYLWLFKDVNE